MMSLERRVRRIYDRRPYPPTAWSKRPRWSLPAIEWIDAVRETARPLDPKRILVAGCGTGSEAGAFAQRFPAAAVVGVDFCERSLDIARRTVRNCTFELADLSKPGLIERSGGSFDLVSCHGVLSYIPDPEAVFRNFARVLAPDGILVLGVNGSTHPNVKFRRALPEFGIAPDEFEESRRVRDVLRIFDCLAGPRAFATAGEHAAYLASDIFTPFNLSLPLSEWSALLDRSNLHLLASYQGYYATRELVDRDLHSGLMPRSRRATSELADELQPSTFHQLVVSRRRPAAVPWSDPRALLRWRPVRTRLYEFRWPRNGGPPLNLREMAMTSEATHTGVDLNVPQWEVDLLRGSDGSRSLDEIVGRTPKPSALAEAIYPLYLLAAVNVLPPASD